MVFTVKMQTLIIASFVICAKPNSQIRLAPSCSFNYLLICFVFQCLEASSQPTELKFTLGDPDDQKVAPQELTKFHFHNSKLVEFDRFYKETWFLNYSRVWKMHERHLTCRAASFTDFKLHWKSLDIFSNWAPNEPWQSWFAAKYCFLLLIYIICRQIWNMQYGPGLPTLPPTPPSPPPQVRN